jgi:hypothetical protein
VFPIIATYSPLYWNCLRLRLLTFSSQSQAFGMPCHLLGVPVASTSQCAASHPRSNHSVGLTRSLRQIQPVSLKLALVPIERSLGLSSPPSSRQCCSWKAALRVRADAAESNKIAVFVSGGGSNFKAIHSATLDGRIKGTVGVCLVPTQGTTNRIATLSMMV